MAGLAQRVLSERSLRNAARSTFDQRLAQVRQDIEARGIGGRIADKVGGDARDMLDEAVEVADQNRGVVAGTIVALLLWFFRNPIMAWAETVLGANSADKDTDDE